MKRILILFSIISTSFAARADLMLQQQSVMPGWTNDVVVKIHRNKMRADGKTATGRMYQIVDLITHDSCMVMPEQKTVQRTSSEQIAKAMKDFGLPTGNDYAPPKPVDTGKSEVVDGYKAEIYNWTNKTSGGSEDRQILWVAEDFPNYKAIQGELPNLDRFHDSGFDRGMFPDLNLLPGMVVKTEETVENQSRTTILISAKVESVDPSEFEVPSDYTDWKPKVSPMPVTTTTNSNK